MPESIAKAYVQILPTTQGITNNLEQELDGEVGKAGTSAGKSFGSNLLSTLAKIGIAKKIGDTFSDAILQGSSLQQSIGGIETLFKDNADTVKEYAKEKSIENSNKSDKIKSSKDFKTIVLQRQEYAHVMSEIATNLTDEQKEKSVFKKSIGKYAYTVENNGFGNYRIIGKKEIR